MFTFRRFGELLFGHSPLLDSEVFSSGPDHIGIHGRPVHTQKVTIVTAVVTDRRLLQDVPHLSGTRQKETIAKTLATWLNQSVVTFLLSLLWTHLSRAVVANRDQAIVVVRTPGQTGDFSRVTGEPAKRLGYNHCTVAWTLWGKTHT